MKQKLVFSGLFLALSMASAPTARAITTWYVDGVNGSDSNNCLSTLTACKTIGHAISLASSGDSILVAAATYTENLNIGFSLKLIGSVGGRTIINGGGVHTVVTVSNVTAHVGLSNLTVENGRAMLGGGIYNKGILKINSSVVGGNSASGQTGVGGGIYNLGTLTISNSSVSGNTARGSTSYGRGGGISNGGTVTIKNSIIAYNAVRGGFGVATGGGGGIENYGTVTVDNSTLIGNTGGGGGGIENHGALILSNSTLSGNSASLSGGGILNSGGTTTVQNSIIANSPKGGNCGGVTTSNGYNMSSDLTCSFHNSGDRVNTDPMLGPLQNNGGPTSTMALSSGSRAIDAGNPSGCTDGSGRLLMTDQRGFPRPDKEDSGGCDMGAFERQKD